MLSFPDSDNVPAQWPGSRNKKGRLSPTITLKILGGGRVGGFRCVFFGRILSASIIHSHSLWLGSSHGGKVVWRMLSVMREEGCQRESWLSIVINNWQKKLYRESAVQWGGHFIRWTKNAVPQAHPPLKSWWRLCTRDLFHLQCFRRTTPFPLLLAVIAVSTYHFPAVLIHPMTREKCILVVFITYWRPITLNELAMKYFLFQNIFLQFYSLVATLLGINVDEWLLELLVSCTESLKHRK